MPSVIKNIVTYCCSPLTNFSGSQLMLQLSTCTSAIKEWRTDMWSECKNYTNPPCSLWQTVKIQIQSWTTYVRTFWNTCISVWRPAIMTEIFAVFKQEHDCFQVSTYMPRIFVMLDMFNKMVHIVTRFIHVNGTWCWNWRDVCFHYGATHLWRISKYAPFVWIMMLAKDFHEITLLQHTKLPL